MNRWAAVARFGGLGDNLMAASPFRALKRMGYMIEMITSEPNHVVYHNNPFIDKIAIKDTKVDLPEFDAWQKWFDSRAKEYDLFIHASHSCEGRHAFFKTMTAFWWSVEQRRKVAAGNYLETVHDIANVPYEFGPLFFPTAEEYANALKTKQQVGERFLLWVLSGTRIDKVYPYAPMAVARIIREVNAPVVLMGGPSEKEHSMAVAIKEYVETANGDRKGLHLAVPAGSGELCWPLRTSLSLALVADLVVTPDTGTAWAVAFEKMPKIVMVSHASVENITKHWVNTTTLHADPYEVACWPCHRLHDDPSTCFTNKEGNGARCISNISVEKLVSTVAERWHGERNVIRAEQVFSMARPAAPGWRLPGSERFS